MAAKPKARHYLQGEFVRHGVEHGFALTGPGSATAFLVASNEASVRVEYEGLIDASKGCSSAVVTVLRGPRTLETLKRPAAQDDVYQFKADRPLYRYIAPVACRRQANVLAMILYGDLLASITGDDPVASGYAAASVTEAFRVGNSLVTRGEVIQNLLAAWGRPDPLPVWMSLLGSRFSIDAVVDQLRDRGGNPGR